MSSLKTWMGDFQRGFALLLIAGIFAAGYAILAGVAFELVGQEILRLVSPSLAGLAIKVVGGVGFIQGAGKGWNFVGSVGR